MTDDEPEQKIEVGDLVELAPGMEDVYIKAVAGSRGRVADIRQDDDGFVRVKIEWDQKHWRYNGQEDGWTYLNHFQPAQPNSLFAAKEDPEKFAEKLIERVRALGGDDDEIEEFIDKLNEVVNLLSESEGFIILTAREESSPTQPDDTVLIPYTYGGFLSQRAAVLLEAQMLNMASSVYGENAARMFRHFSDDEE
jgi:hypothetical protein